MPKDTKKITNPEKDIIGFLEDVKRNNRRLSDERKAKRAREEGKSVKGGR